MKIITIRIVLTGEDAPRLVTPSRALVMRFTLPNRANVEPMSKHKRDPDLRDEYDFSRGERGKYAKRFAEGSNVVVLDPDVAKRFGDSASVNEALRSLLDRGQVKPSKK